MQERCPELVYRYWEETFPGGKREDDPQGKDQFTVFAIRDHQRWCGGKYFFLTHWTGFRETEYTWEPRQKLARCAPYLYDLYMRTKLPNVRPLRVRE